LASRQASRGAYLDDFKLMLWITLVAIPMLLLMRPAKRSRRTGAAPADAHAAFE
jgi:DHA2 family multidrug resistance protein